MTQTLILLESASPDYRRANSRFTRLRSICTVSLRWLLEQFKWFFCTDILVVKPYLFTNLLLFHVCYRFVFPFTIVIFFLSEKVEADRRSMAARLPLLITEDTVRSIAEKKNR